MGALWDEDTLPDELWLEVFRWLVAPGVFPAEDLSSGNPFAAEEPQPDGTGHSRAVIPAYTAIAGPVADTAVAPRTIGNLSCSCRKFRMLLVDHLLLKLFCHRTWPRLTRDAQLSTLRVDWRPLIRTQLQLCGQLDRVSSTRWDPVTIEGVGPLDICGEAAKATLALQEADLEELAARQARDAGELQQAAAAVQRAASLRSQHQRWQQCDYSVPSLLKIGWYEASEEHSEEGNGEGV